MATGRGSQVTKRAILLLLIKVILNDCNDHGEIIFLNIVVFILCFGFLTRATDGTSPTLLDGALVRFYCTI